MKKLLTYDQLIQHMKEKGIKFKIVSEEEAKEFLKGHNYYMKLASYRFNYSKYGADHLKRGEYQNLDFGYLKELSTIDMYLRRYVEQMCLDIEHAIKVRLIDEVTRNPHENGYEIVRSYFAEEDSDLRLLKSIRKHKSGEYCKDLFQIIYAFLTIFLYLLKCPQSLILSALRAFCFCGKPHISRSIFLYFRYQTWLKSW